MNISFPQNRSTSGGTRLTCLGSGVTPHTGISAAPRPRLGQGWARHWQVFLKSLLEGRPQHTTQIPTSALLGKAAQTLERRLPSTKSRTAAEGQLSSRNPRNGSYRIRHRVGQMLQGHSTVTNHNCQTSFKGNQIKIIKTIQVLWLHHLRLRTAMMKNTNVNTRG